jgi:hypothetical protein
MTIKQVIGQLKYDRDFELAIQFHDQTQVNLKPLETPDFEDVDFSSNGQGTQGVGFWGGSNLSLKDCLSLFS